MRIQLYISEKAKSVDINNKLVTTLLRLLESAAGHVVTDENPDIVHFLGCWDIRMAHAATNIRRRMIPYVYSPLGGLQPWEIDEHKLAKHTQILAFQRQLTKEAAVVHVGGEMEHKSITRKKWNSNVRIIESPFVSNDITEDELVSQLLDLYEETINSHNTKIKEDIAQRVSEVKEDDETINSLLREILYARYQLHRGGLPSLTLDNLSTHLTKSDIDEDHFEQLLDDMRISKFFARLECVMATESTLTEGFMPIPMIEDRVADKIKSSITRY